MKKIKICGSAKESKLAICLFVLIGRESFSFCMPWGCAKRFQNVLPHFRPKYVICQSYSYSYRGHVVNVRKHLLLISSDLVHHTLIKYSFRLIIDIHFGFTFILLYFAQ